MNETTLTTRANRLFDASGCPEVAEVNLVLTTDDEIHELNARFRDVDAATDVLSFSMTEGEDAEFVGDLLGDIVVSVDRAAAQAADGLHGERVGREGPWTLEDEIVFLGLHGLLHLLGYDHNSPDLEAEMRAEERRIWGDLDGQA